jgi:hypothetical protein
VQLPVVWPDQGFQASPHTPAGEIEVFAAFFSSLRRSKSRRLGLLVVGIAFVRPWVAILLMKVVRTGSG